MSQQFLNYYELLGVRHTATPHEIESAFKAAAKKYHPDKQGNNESSNRLFQYLNDARVVLTDITKRKQYDELIGLLPRPEPLPKVVFRDRIVIQNTPKPEDAAAIGILGILLGVGIAVASSGGKKK